MKNTKKYLNLALPIALCVSIHSFSMEKERSSASGEWSEKTEDANISGESKETQNILETRIKKLKDINKTISNMLLNNDDTTSTKKFKLEKLQILVQNIIAVANDMYLGLTPVNILFINQKMNSILNQWNQITTSSESSSY